MTQEDRGRLLDDFRADPDAVLCGTASFEEGIDVPGRSLRMVILDKLPFEHRTDPVSKARQERHGRAGFVKVCLPDMVLRLAQAVGRLIRTSEDRGVVAILDDRLVTARYGGRALDALPSARRCRGLDDTRWLHPQRAEDHAAA